MTGNDDSDGFAISDRAIRDKLIFKARDFRNVIAGWQLLRDGNGKPTGPLLNREVREILEDGFVMLVENQYHAEHLKGTRIQQESGQMLRDGPSLVLYDQLIKAQQIQERPEVEQDIVAAALCGSTIKAAITAATDLGIDDAKVSVKYWSAICRGTIPARTPRQRP